MAQNRYLTMRRRRMAAQPQSRALTLTGGVINDAYRALGIQGDGQAVGSHAGTGVWPAATNLCTNGGFETNTTGWGSINAATIARITSDSQFGTACCEITCTGTQYGGAQWPTAALLNATAYTYSVWVKRSEVVDDWRIDLSSGGLTGNTVIPPVLGWQRVILTATSTSTLATILRVLNYSVGAASTIKVDGAQFETGSIATPYIETDGGTANRAAGHVQMPVPTGFNATAGAVIMRGVFPSGLLGTGTPRLWEWGTGYPHSVLQAVNPIGNITTYYGDAGGADSVVNVGSSLANQSFTTIGRWGGGLIGVARDGSAIGTSAETRSPAFTGSIEIGRDAAGTEISGIRAQWLALYGSGGQFLGNGDSAHVARLGAVIDPLSDLPRPDGLLAFWDGVNDRAVYF